MKLAAVLAILYLFTPGRSQECPGEDSSFVEIKLRKKLLCKYDKSVRPETKINMHFDYTLKGFQFTEKKRELRVESLIFITWQDERLQWNPAEYNNLTKNYAPFDSLWVPDISLVESDTKDDVLINGCTAVSCNIYPDGMVECPMPCEHTAICNEADFTNWPFDYAACSMTYMSRIYAIRFLNFIAHSLTVDFDGGTENRAWNLISAFGDFGNETLNDFALSTFTQASTFSYIRMNFTIERENKEIIFQVIIPAGVLIVFNIAVLFLAANLSERWILYAISIFCHQMYNVQLYWLLPENADSIPNIFIFFCDSQIITTILMIESLMMKIYLTSKNDDSSDWLLTMHNFLSTTRFNQLMPIVKVKSESTKQKRLNASQLIERILIIFLTIVYLYMFIALMPAERKMVTNPILMPATAY